MSDWKRFKRRHVTSYRIESGQIVSFYVQTPESLDALIKKNTWGKEFAILKLAVKEDEETIITETSLAIGQILNLIDLGAFDPYESGRKFGPAVRAVEITGARGNSLLRFERTQS